MTLNRTGTLCSVLLTMATVATMYVCGCASPSGPTYTPTPTMSQPSNTIESVLQYELGNYWSDPAIKGTINRLYDNQTIGYEATVKLYQSNIDTKLYAIETIIPELQEHYLFFLDLSGERANLKKVYVFSESPPKIYDDKDDFDANSERAGIIMSDLFFSLMILKVDVDIPPLGDSATIFVEQYSG
jgi:hypothetical protein